MHKDNLIKPGVIIALRGSSADIYE